MLVSPTALSTLAEVCFRTFIDKAPPAGHPWGVRPKHDAMEQWAKHPIAPASPNNHHSNIMSKKTFTRDQAEAIGNQLGIAWDTFDLEQFRDGLGVELEHGTANRTTDVTNDDSLMTGKIALAHLTEFPDYYTRLAKMEAEAKQYWSSRNTPHGVHHQDPWG